ncbi:zinc/iron transporter [Holotrichia oblita]|nr:zinc/iron transporter [Holotrichia oblita]
MCIGVAFGLAGAGLEGAEIAGALLLSLGIGLQNFPEGAAVSLPLHRDGASKAKSFLFGQASGIVEPVAAMLGFVFATSVQGLLPLILGFSAGAMVAVAASELLPEAAESKNFSAVGCVIGFVLMMVMETIKIYLTDAVFTFEKNKDFLHPQRKNELEQINNKKVCDEKTTSSILLDFAVFTQDKSIPLPVATVKDDNDKPYLEHSNYEFSCSHSHGICACAISNCPLGLDIEKDRELKSFAAAKKIFDNGELEKFEKIKDNKSYVFLKYWTNIESRLKLSGKGLKGLFNNGTQDTDELYSFYFYTLGTHITCTAQKNITPEVITIEGEQLKKFISNYYIENA